MSSQPRFPQDLKSEVSLKLFLRDLSTQVDFESLAYHVHFPGDTSVISGFPKHDSPISLLIPARAKAVCVTLVKRIKLGWVRHSRCRFTLDKHTHTCVLRDESLGIGTPAYGTAELTVPNVRALEFVQLTREWYDVGAFATRVFQNSNADWFKTCTPVNNTVKHVHASTWNNFKDVGVPGWCFAFPPSGENKYSVTDLQEAFKLASEMLSSEPHLSANIFFKKPSDVSEIVALGITLFGNAISFENDHTARGTSVERFSSTARLDGLGDCEDIAKETALAFGDLVSYDKTDNVFLACLSARAKRFQFCICLSTVRRKRGGPLEAHAFGMLIPNSAFPHSMLTEKEIESLSNEGETCSYMCDGVYDCHPAKRKVSVNDGLVVGKDAQLAPWNYEIIVSAFVYNKGEVFFHKKGNSKTYGVPLNALFPVVKKDTVCTDALGSDSTVSMRKRAAASVLTSNIPRSTRMFGFETQTPMDRFYFVVSETPGLATRMLRTFPSMYKPLQTRFRRLVKHLRAPCLTREAFKEAHKATEGREETAFQIDSTGEMIGRTKGKYGSVVEPSPSAAGGPVVGGHSHHRQKGVDSYRECNVPTPEDFVSFAARRVFALLRSQQHRPTALHQAAIVVTHNNVYELNELGESNGIVTCTFMDLVRKDRNFTENEVWLEVRKRLIKRLGVNKFVEIKPPSECFSLIKGTTIFSSHGDHDEYLNFFQKATRIRAVRQEVAAYREQCGI